MQLLTRTDVVVCSYTINRRDTMTEAMTISTEGRVGSIDLENFNGMQDFVGGYVQAVNGQINDEPFTLYVNEDGKTYGLEPNIVASALVADVLQAGDFISGNAVLLGPPGPEGENTPPPNTLVDGLTLALNA